MDRMIRENHEKNLLKEEELRNVHAKEVFERMQREKEEPKAYRRLKTKKKTDWHFLTKNEEYHEVDHSREEEFCLR